MRVIIDNNVILDVFQNREPFVQFSSRVLRLVETNRIRGYITANSVTDIHYVLNRYIKDKKKVYEILDSLLKLVDIIDVTADDVKKAFYARGSDFEDELLCVCAERVKIDYIITRNIKDFNSRNIKVAKPEDFLNSFFEHF